MFFFRFLYLYNICGFNSDVYVSGLCTSKMVIWLRQKLHCTRIGSPHLKNTAHSSGIWKMSVRLFILRFVKGLFSQLGNRARNTQHTRLVCFCSAVHKTPKQMKRNSKFHGSLIFCGEVFEIEKETKKVVRSNLSNQVNTKIDALGGLEDAGLDSIEIGCKWHNGIG